MVFVGSLHGRDSPNADSLLWFARDVIPQIEARLGKPMSLDVIGFNSMQDDTFFDGYERRFRFVGKVETLKPHLERKRIMVIPTRFASGIPQKAYDAARYGIPTICTRSSPIRWDGRAACTRSRPIGAIRIASPRRAASFTRNPIYGATSDATWSTKWSSASSVHHSRARCGASRPSSRAEGPHKRLCAWRRPNAHI